MEGHKMTIDTYSQTGNPAHGITKIFRATKDTVAAMAAAKQAYPDMSMGDVINVLQQQNAADEKFINDNHSKINLAKEIRNLCEPLLKTGMNYGQALQKMVDEDNQYAIEIYNDLYGG